MKLLFPFYDYTLSNPSLYPGLRSVGAGRGHSSYQAVKQIKDEKTLTFIISVPGAVSGTFKVKDSILKISLKRQKELTLDAFPEKENIEVLFNNAENYEIDKPVYKKLTNGILKIIFKLKEPENAVITHSF